MNKKVEIYKDPRRFSRSLKEKSKGNKLVLKKVEEFITEKINSPKQSLSVGDTPLTGGHLKDSRLWHYDIGKSLRLYYRTDETPNEIQIKFYGVFTHEETGTGTPPNQQKQKSFAQSVEQAEDRLVKFKRNEETKNPIIECYSNWISNNCQLWS